MRDLTYDTIYETETAHWWYRVRRNIVKKILAARAKDVGGACLRILDVGCGTGQLMKEMHQFGPVYGVDISQRAVAYCKARGLAPLIATADRLPYGDETFDTIVALDVLEHLQDDRAGAKELARVLSANGTAVIAVPAFMFLWGITDEVSHHYRRYTRKEIVALVEEAGLRVRHATYFNTLLFPAIAAVRLAVRFLRIPVESEGRIRSKIINEALYGIFSFESRLLTHIRFPFGVSVLVIASRS
jgi:2-polyprenyl-3-methyl-5-hydroxy-6-metoxy-1,4-benzoquinol methylase